MNKLHAKVFQASTISIYDFSTLYTTLLNDSIEHPFMREELLYLACNEEWSEEDEKYSLWTCQKETVALACLSFGQYLYTWKKVREHLLSYEGKLWSIIFLLSKYLLTKLFS